MDELLLIVVYDLLLLLLVTNFFFIWWLVKEPFVSVGVLFIMVTGAFGLLE